LLAAGLCTAAFEDAAAAGATPLKAAISPPADRAAASVASGVLLKVLMVLLLAF
jgi:hypothetical protein